MSARYVVPSYRYKSNSEPDADHTIVCVSPWSQNASRAGDTTSIDHDVGASVGDTVIVGACVGSLVTDGSGIGSALVVG